MRALNVIPWRHSTAIDQLSQVVMHHSLHLFGRGVVQIHGIPVAHLVRRALVHQSVHQWILVAEMAMHDTPVHGASHATLASTIVVLSLRLGGEGDVTATTNGIVKAGGTITDRALMSELIISFVLMSLMTKSNEL